jgi:hypothetical protein
MMRLPRPASPRALWRDIREFLGTRRPHQMIAAFLAVGIPVTIITAFLFDTADAERVAPQVIYVESWPADRSSEEIRAKQAIDEQRRQRFEAERQRQFQRLDQSLNKLGI